MKPSRLVIAILPGRIDAVGFHRGRVVGSGRAAVDLAAEAEDWPRRLRRCAPAIKALAADVGKGVTGVEVLYVSPTQVVEQVSLAARSISDAREAAILGATETLAYPSTSAVVQAIVAARDAAGDGRRLHMLVAAERDSILSAIVETMEEAGLRVESLAPLEAAVIASLLGRSLERDDAARGRLFVGEASSFFVVECGGRICFGRRIAMGVRNLISSLTRPIAGAGGRQPIELDLAAAAAALFDCGIRRGDDAAAAPAEPGRLTAQQLLPLMQPVLQRMVVELRQSLRFGMTEDQRQSLQLTILGPGAAVPGFADLIGAELRVACAAETRQTSFDLADPACEGCDLRVACDAETGDGGLNLLPQAMTAAHGVGRLRNWLWSGAMVAAAFIAFDAVRLHGRLADARQQAKSVALQATGLDVLRATTQRLSSAVAAMNDLEAKVARETGMSPDVAAIMHELSRLTPASIRLESMSLSRAGERIEGLIAGHAPKDDAAAGGGLDAYVAALRESPLLGEVGLRNVQFTAVGGVDVQQFEVTFLPVPAPTGLLANAPEPGRTEAAP